MINFFKQTRYERYKYFYYYLCNLQTLYEKQFFKIDVVNRMKMERELINLNNICKLMRPVNSKEHLKEFKIENADKTRK